MGEENISRLQTEELQKAAILNAKRTRNGVSLNLVYSLTTGQRIKVKKVNDRMGTFYCVQLPGPSTEIFRCGQLLHTTSTQDGTHMDLEVLKKRGSKWVMKILGIS